MSKVTTNNLITLGKIIKPHGIRGEIKVIIYNLNPSELNNIKTLYIKEEDTSTYKPIHIKEIRSLNDNFIIRLQEVTNRNDAELYRNQKIYMDKKDLPPLSENEFYIFDLLNKQAFDTKDNYLGEIIDIYSTPLYEVVIIAKGDLRVDIPVISEYFVDVVEDKVIMDDISDFPVYKERTHK